MCLRNCLPARLSWHPTWVQSVLVDDADLQAEPQGPPHSATVDVNAPAETPGLITKEPFGGTEKQVAHQPDAGLGDVDFLDLDAQVQSTTTPGRQIRGLAPSAGPPAIAKPPNPLESNSEHDAPLPVRDHKLVDYDPSAMTSGNVRHGTTNGNHSDEALPRVKPGEGEGPEVLYGSDIVLDVSGYHNELNPQGSASASSDKAQVQASVLDSFTRDLTAAIEETGARPFLTHSPSTDPDVSTVMVTPRPEADNSASPIHPPQSPSRSDRGQSEPPPDVERTPRRHVARAVNGVSHVRSSTIDPASPTAVMDYAWDWGRLPETSSHSGEVEDYDRDGNSSPAYSSASPQAPRVRADSMGSELDRAAQALSSSHTLSGSDSDPFLITFSTPSGGSYSFELSLCGENGQTSFARGDVSNTTEPIADMQVEEEANFLQNRITYQRFLEDPDIIDDPQLILRCSLSYVFLLGANTDR